MQISTEGVIYLLLLAAILIANVNELAIGLRRRKRKCCLFRTFILQLIAQILMSAVIFNTVHILLALVKEALNNTSANNISAVKVTIWNIVEYLFQFMWKG